MLYPLHPANFYRLFHHLDEIPNLDRDIQQNRISTGSVMDHNHLVSFREIKTIFDENSIRDLEGKIWTSPVPS